MTSSKVAFIGGGQMAQALCRGAVEGGMLSESDVVFAEPNSDQQQVLRKKFASSQIVGHAAEAMAAASKIILSVKPHVLKAIAPQLAPTIEPHHLLISIAAGIPLDHLQGLFATPRVIRVMPNTPAQVGAGAAAIAADDQADEADVQWVETLMQAVGTSVRVPDHLMHAVTAVSGSGPAYIYLVIEALSDGGVAMGLPRETALRLAAQTVCGAARMVLETGEHPGRLKDQVTSPGGTTIAAIRELEAAGIRSAFMEAVIQAAERSQELSS